MNYKIINKSNNLISLLKNSRLNKFIKVLQKLNSAFTYILKNQPYLFDDTETRKDVYTLKESYHYKDNTDLRLIESRRTFL